MLSIFNYAEYGDGTGSENDGNVEEKLEAVFCVDC
jgi:hypothetical protein